MYSWVGSSGDPRLEQSLTSLMEKFLGIGTGDAEKLIFNLLSQLDPGTLP